MWNISHVPKFQKNNYWSERWWVWIHLHIPPNKPFPATSREETKDFCRWLLDMSPERRPSDASKALTHPFLRGWVRLNPWKPLWRLRIARIGIGMLLKKHLEKHTRCQPNTTASNSVHGIVFLTCLTNKGISISDSKSESISCTPFVFCTCQSTGSWSLFFRTQGIGR